MSGERCVAIVSGGSRGLGEAIVADLLRSKAIVATFSRSATPWIERCQAADADGASFHWEAIDGGDFPRLGEFVRGVLQRFGRIDVLVNNMATITDGLLALSRDADIHRQVSMNLEAAVLLTRACLKGMLPQGSGSIVNISSVNALRGHTGVSVYSATKAALIGLTKSLAVEVGPGGIRVNCVAPGWVATDMSAATLRDPELGPKIAAAIPVGRVGHAQEIAGPVLFLCTPLAGFISGEVVNVNGGAVLAG